MYMIEAREQKRQRTVSNSQGLDNMEEDTLVAIEGGKQCKDENLGETEDMSGTIELLTDDENWDDEDSEGNYKAYDVRVMDMPRRPDYQDEIDRAAMKIDKCSVPRTSLSHILRRESGHKQLILFR